jgi:uncharacterized protein (DUF4415 family)
MYVTDRNGRKYRIPTKEETKRIREGIAADPDTHELTDEEMAELRPLSEMKRLPGRPKAEATKERVTIRLSPEVTAYFRATGKGWQTRLDEALREYIDARR